MRVPFDQCTTTGAHRTMPQITPRDLASGLVGPADYTSRCFFAVRSHRRGRHLSVEVAISIVPIVALAIVSAGCLGVLLASRWARIAQSIVVVTMALLCILLFPATAPGSGLLHAF